MKTITKVRIITSIFVTVFGGLSILWVGGSPVKLCIVLGIMLSCGIQHGQREGWNDTVGLREK